jgi:hypothetical protein
MRIPKNNVPLIPLQDFGSSPFLEHGIFVEAFEECVSIRHERMEVHRHDYVELFLLHGQGAVLIDFESHPLSGSSIIAIGQGRVHAWKANKMTGLYIAFTQEFFDGTGPPPSALFDYPFLFEGELSSVIHLMPTEGAQARDLVREISSEFASQEKLAVEMIRHQLRSLMVHLSRLYAAESPAPFAAVGLVRRLATNSNALHTFSFLMLLYFAVFSIVSARERSWFWATLPSKTFMAALVADALTGSVLTFVGLPGLKPLPWWQTLAIFACAMVSCLAVNDAVKVAMIKWRILNAVARKPADGP